jgi:hypothetical protein
MSGLSRTRLYIVGDCLYFSMPKTSSANAREHHQPIIVVLYTSTDVGALGAYLLIETRIKKKPSLRSSLVPVFGWRIEHRIDRSSLKWRRVLVRSKFVVGGADPLIKGGALG